MPVDVTCPRCDAELAVTSLISGEQGPPYTTCGQCDLTFLFDFTGLDPAGTSSAVEYAPSVRIEGYRLIGVLARGGMGYVYSAVNEEDGQLIALKVLPPRVANWPPLVARFDREIRLMRSVRHPNIMEVFGAGLTESGRFLAMPFYPGKTLKARMMNNAPLSLTEVRAILRPLGEGLDQLHRSAILHRDLKPGNILLTAMGTIVLCDFGVACELDRRGDLTQAELSIGTPAYVAPEVYERGEMTPLSDLFSLAVVTYQMLTGVLALGVFERPSETCPGLPKESENALLIALHHHPHRRYDTVGDFIRAFCRPLRGLCDDGIADADIIAEASLPSIDILETADSNSVVGRANQTSKTIKTLLAKMGLGA